LENQVFLALLMIFTKEILYDEEEDKILEDSHDVTAVICAQFDGEGDCYAFDILKLQPVL
jgi:hypothetical protein